MMDIVWLQIVKSACTLALVPYCIHMHSEWLENL
jgi:hypothetical protein